MKVFFIRHGETEKNIQGIVHTANDEVSLNITGKKQAEKIAEKYPQLEILYTSPEKRANETAQIIAGKLSIEVNIINELRERNWGDWEGKTWEEIKKYLETLSLEQRYEFIPPNGESWKQMDERLKHFIEFLKQQTYQNVGVVSHGGVLRALIPIIKNQSPETSFKYDFSNASVSIFNYEKGIFTEELLNDVSHLK